MGTTYAVSWKDAAGSTDSGRLELGRRALCLHGSAIVEVPYRDLAGVSIGRGKGDRLRGRSTVVLSRKNALPIWIAPVAQSTALLELFERLSRLASPQ